MSALDPKKLLELVRTGHYDNERKLGEKEGKEEIESKVGELGCIPADWMNQLTSKSSSASCSTK